MSWREKIGTLLSCTRNERVTQLRSATTRALFYDGSNGFEPPYARKSQLQYCCSSKTDDKLTADNSTAHVSQRIYNRLLATVTRGYTTD